MITILIQTITRFYNILLPGMRAQLNLNTINKVFSFINDKRPKDISIKHSKKAKVFVYYEKATVFIIFHLFHLR